MHDGRQDAENQLVRLRQFAAAQAGRYDPRAVSKVLVSWTSRREESTSITQFTKHGGHSSRIMRLATRREILKSITYLCYEIPSACAILHR
jgi:hypothetical protein